MANHGKGLSPAAQRTQHTRRNGTARCPCTLPGLRTCYRTRRAQKTRRVLVRGSGSTMNRHTHTQPQKRAARDKRGPRAPHTHCRHTTSATRRPAREERTAHTQFKFECDRAPSECAGPGSRRGRRHGFSMTATVRPRDGGTVAAVYTWNSQSMDGPAAGGRSSLARRREGIINGGPGAAARGRPE